MGIIAQIIAGGRLEPNNRKTEETHGKVDNVHHLYNDASMDRQPSTKKVKSFIEFLEARGAEVLPSTNEYELVRFYANQVMSVVYINKSGSISSFLNEGERAYCAFLNLGKWSVENNGVGRKMKRDKKDQRKAGILARDGEDCFFCGKHMDESDRTLEHLLSIVHGGSNHISNLVLAHQECNIMASHMSIAEKVLLREKFLYGEWRGEA